MSHASFTTGEPFPLPIRAAGDGALFQVDVNGTMFILQLGKTDLVATEAFRTGKMELALAEENGILFLLYRIDGIFKEGWGDAPLALHTLGEMHQPTEESLAERELYLYLIDSHFHTLLAQRKITLNEKFAETLKDFVLRAQKNPRPAETFSAALHNVWKSCSSADLRTRAVAVQEIPLTLSPPKHGYHMNA